MGIWRLIHPRVFLIFFYSFVLGCFFSFWGAFIHWHTFFVPNHPIGSTVWSGQLVFFWGTLCGFCLSVVGGFHHSSLFKTFFYPRIAPLLALYKYKGFRVGGKRR